MKKVVTVFLLGFVFVACSSGSKPFDPGSLGSGGAGSTGSGGSGAIATIPLFTRSDCGTRVKKVLFENEIGLRVTDQGTLAVGEVGSYWVRLRNGNKDLNTTMTINAE